MAGLAEKIKKESDSRNVFFLILLILIIRSIFSFRIGFLVQATGADEFGTIAGAAFFGGADWSSIVSQCCPYYGFGYSTLFFWIFGVTDNPAFLHIAITLLNTLLLCCVGIMSYTMMRRHFLVKDKLLSFIAALASALFFDSLVYANLAINETMLVFIIWLVLLIILEISIAEKALTRFILNVCLALICAYSLMVHTRSIIIICAVAVTTAMMMIFTRKMPVNILVYGPVLGIGYAFSNRVVDMVQEILWKAEDGSELVNSAGSAFESLKYAARLIEPGGIKGFLYALLGQVYMAFSLSGGLLAIGCIIGIVILVSGFGIKKKAGDDKSVIEDYSPYGLAVCFIFSALAATLVLNVITALRLTPDIILGNPASGSQKWFVYVRYNALFCSPVVMLVFSGIYKYREKVRAIVNWAFILFAAVSASFFYFIADYMEGVNSGTSGEFYFLAPLSKLKIGEALTIRSFITMSIVSVAVFAVIYLFVRFRKEWIAGVVFIILNVYIFGFISVNIHEVNAARIESYSKEYAEVIRSLEDIYDVPQLYFYKEEGGAMYAYSSQFALSRYAIEFGLPEDDGSEAIVFAVGPTSKLFDGGEYDEYYFGSNKHLFVRGKDAQHMVDRVVEELFDVKSD